MARAHRADQATARASATSEFTGPRCGRSSRAPCRARPSGCGNLTKQTTAVRTMCNLELYNLFWIQLQLDRSHPSRRLGSAA